MEGVGVQGGSWELCILFGVQFSLAAVPCAYRGLSLPPSARPGGPHTKAIAL